MTIFLLDRWRDLLATPQTLSFSHMELLGRDLEPSIVAGEGTVEIPDAYGFTYMLSGVPADLGHCLRLLQRQREHRYDGLMRFRLVAKDSLGSEVHGGWTVPSVSTENDDWRFYGEIEELHFRDRTESSAYGGVELLFLIPSGHPAFVYLSRFTTPDPSNCDGPRFHQLSVLGSEIEFRFEPQAGFLWIKANATAVMNHPHLENCLGEPLRILFGQLIYPRLLVRIQAGGDMSVSLRMTPRWYRRADWAALWSGDESLIDGEGFWYTYARLLTHVATARDEAGQPNFEAHKITTLYGEIVQATSGSRWVWALTFASTVEALLQMIVPRKTPRPGSDNEAIERLCANIETLPGDKGMKDVAISAVRNLAYLGTRAALRDLENKRIITAEQFKAWDATRNSVMHGSLVSPYSSEEEDQKLVALSELTHVLTRHIVGAAPPSCPRSGEPDAYDTTSKPPGTIEWD